MFKEDWPVIVAWTIVAIAVAFFVLSFEIIGNTGDLDAPFAVEPFSVGKAVSCNEACAEPNVLSVIFGFGKGRALGLAFILDRDRVLGRSCILRMQHQCREKQDRQQVLFQDASFFGRPPSETWKIPAGLS